MVNLSGGVGIPYRPEDAIPDITAIGDGVRGMYEEIIEKNGVAPLRVATELGRWLVGPCGWLVTTAIHEKHTYREYIGLDACAVDLMRPAIYGAYHQITVAGKEGAPNDHVYDVIGSLCENNDKFAVQRALPRIELGDLVVVHDTGAHGHTMGYNYNGKLRSAEVLLKPDGSFKLIRRRQTPADYFATLDFPPLRDVL
jgi:diaminopimelate decarboxylase